MSTKAYQANKDRQLKKEIADKDREVSKIAAQGTYNRGKAAQVQAQINKQDLIRKIAADDYHRVVEFPFSAVKSIGDIAVKGIGNDPQWYRNFPELTDALGKLSQYFPLGKNLWDKKDLNTKRTFGDEVAARLPSVMSIEYVDTIGKSFDTQFHSQLPINVSTQRVITNARANNSRIGGYAVGDLAQVLLASSNVYVYLAWIRRGIRISQTFDENKKGLRESLLRAGGYNVTLFVEHLADVKATLATLLEDANANLFIPSKYDLLHRKLFLVDNVFLDSASKESPMYIFKPRYFWVYSEDEAIITPYPSDTIGSISNLHQLFNSMMKDLMYSEEITNLISDLKFAFHSDNFIMDMPNMDDKLTFAVGYEPILEIRNLLMPMIGRADALMSSTSETGYLYDAYKYANPVEASLSIKQDVNGFIYQGYSETSGFDSVFIRRDTDQVHIEIGNKYEFIATPTDELTADEVLVATRLMPKYELSQVLYSQLGYSNNNRRATFISSCGTEYVLSITVYTAIAPEEYDNDLRETACVIAPFINITNDFNVDNLLVGSLTDKAITDMTTIYAVSNFNARPRTKVISVPLSTVPPIQQSNSVGCTEYDDLQYFAHKFPISWDNLDLLTNACNKSLYYINMSIRRETKSK